VMNKSITHENRGAFTIQMPCRLLVAHPFSRMLLPFSVSTPGGSLYYFVCHRLRGDLAFACSTPNPHGLAAGFCAGYTSNALQYFRKYLSVNLDQEKSRQRRSGKITGGFRKQRNQKSPSSDFPDHADNCIYTGVAIPESI